MTAKWSAIGDKDKYGIVISNLRQNLVLPHRLHLSIGDSVRILEECGQWYYGYCLKNRHQKGIFPKNYICIKDAVIDKTGAHEVVIPREPPIIQEITSVIREWGAIWKQLYITSNPNFRVIREAMYELITWRKQIMSGTLPADEMKELKQKVTAKIDHGNAILTLDLVVRDDSGNILNPDITSTVDLYRAHEAATERIKQIAQNMDYKNKRSSTRYNHNLYITVKNFVCRICDDSDLLITLYDGKECVFISENYLVKWGKAGLMRDLDQLNNLRVVFADLGSKDLAREKVYLVCQTIRIGGMEVKEEVGNRKSTHQNMKRSSDGLRRPFGVAAMDITDYLNGKIETDEEKQHFIPFAQCKERDSLDAVIRKIISAREISQNECKGQGLFVSLRLLHGDQKQIREEYAHLVSPFTSVARKMGFPEVILPGDIRNDLYLTLTCGEFSKGSKKSERNIEVTVKVINEKAQTIQNCLSFGAGSELMSEYKSVVYYHEERPKWMETLKISIPIEEFYSGHLRFTFRHRSSNDNKDKTEKPFAMAFIHLMNENGTTLSDRNHELLVYKVDHKRYEESEVAYLKLPSTREDLERRVNDSNHNINQIGVKQLSSMFQTNGIQMSPKDSFSISTVVCSTKLTQNIDLLGLLKWKSNPENLRQNLLALMKVDGEEVVKFLQDTLDALFDILMQNTDSDIYDNYVFEALIFIIGLISDRKYQHFRPVLDVYIDQNFSATLIYNKLIVVLKSYIERINSIPESQEVLLRAMKSLEYIFKFIVRSRVLFAALNGGKGKSQFEESLKDLLQAITSMMLSTSDETLLVQAACLKYFPFALTDILCVFNEEELSYILTDLINNVPVERLTKQKMMCVNDIVHCELFIKYADCRSILLPVINEHLRILLERKEEFELCVRILSDMLVVLSNGRDVGPTQNDISDIMLSLLRTVIQTFVDMDRHDPSIGNVVAILIGILRQMTPHHYNEYINSFASRNELLYFLMEILIVFQDLVKIVFPKDWNEMILLQNSVFLNALRHFAHCIRDKFLHPFEVQLWNNFFMCAISFLTQDSLQLENFSQSKRNKIIARYKDMRREMAFEIRSMWFNLGQYKIQFVPSMVGPFLEMTLIPEMELRKATIPIFFDMMQCEFYSPKSGSYSLQVSSYHSNDTAPHQRSTECKANFKEFENEMISKLDILIEGGRGDEQFKDLFLEIVGTNCEHHSAMRDSGLFFVRTVVRLMRRLLEYRSVVNDENKESLMSCTVNLLEFYNEIERREMYIRYLYKLCDLHLECDNHIEAAYTLALHAKLLKWTDEPLPPLLKNDKFPEVETHRELKELLYTEIINHFDKGKLWETGIAYCKEIIFQYESEIFDYLHLSTLLQRMAVFYDNIIKQARPEPEYFRVAYYGRGFPAFLQNKTFVYRGKEYERLSEFSGRLLNQFPNAQLMTKLDPPGEDIIESNAQYLQINKVDPIMQETDKFRGKLVHEQIVRYYKVNEIKKFTYSRPLRKGERDSDNEFANMWIERTTLQTSYALPGILRRFHVIQTNTVDLSPLENAIETMENSNNKVRNLVIQYRSDSALPLNPLSLALNGIVDAAVMGGIVNYEKAFFTDDYVAKHPLKKDQDAIVRLKNLIAMQIPLLEVGITLHKQRVPPSLKPFHDRMEESFARLKANVEEKYGKRSLPEELVDKFNVKIRRGLSEKGRKVQTHVSAPTKVYDRNSSGSAKSDSVPFSPTKGNSGRSISVWVRPNSQSNSQSISTSTLTKLKKQISKDGVRLRRSETDTGSQPQSAQWYAPELLNKPDPPVIELNEHLSSQRPLRNEYERRFSRPSSGQYRAHPTPSPTRSRSHDASSHASNLSLSPFPFIETIDDKPPPLPMKQSYADYSNLNENGNSNGIDLTLVPPKRRSSGSIGSAIKHKPPPPLPASATPPLSPRFASGPPPELPMKPKRPVPSPVPSNQNDKLIDN